MHEKHTKEYIKNQYQLAYSDFKLARNEGEQWKIRKSMAKLEELAAQKFGFEFVDSLRKSVGLPS